MAEPGKKKYGQKEHEEMELKRMCVCLFLFLKNNDGGVFVTNLKRLRGCRLFDEWAADKEKE